MELACPACTGTIDPEQFDERGEIVCPHCREPLVWDGQLRRASAPASGLACLQCARPLDPDQFDHQGRLACAGCGLALLWDGALRRGETAAPLQPPAVSHSAATTVAQPAARVRLVPSAPGVLPIGSPATSATLQPAIAKALRQRSDHWMYIACGIAGLGLVGAIGYQLSQRPRATRTAAATVAPVPQITDVQPTAAPAIAAPAITAPVIAAPAMTAPATTAPASADPASRTVPAPVAPSPPMPAPGAGSTVSSHEPRQLALLRFRRGTAALPADARPALEAALQELAAAPDAVVEVHGHTDDEGVRERNLELALARAGAVRAWLIIRGIDPARIRMIGHSPDQSAGAASLSAARASNRRAELFLIR